MRDECEPETLLLIAVERRASILLLSALFNVVSKWNHITWLSINRHTPILFHRIGRRSIREEQVATWRAACSSWHQCEHCMQASIPTHCLGLVYTTHQPQHRHFWQVQTSHKWWVMQVQHGFSWILIIFQLMNGRDNLSKLQTNKKHRHHREGLTFPIVTFNFSRSVWV